MVVAKVTEELSVLENIGEDCFGQNCSNSIACSGLVKLVVADKVLEGGPNCQGEMFAARQIVGSLQTERLPLPRNAAEGKFMSSCSIGRLCIDHMQLAPHCCHAWWH